MATTIRMKRGGRTHAPYYKVVVVDSRRRTMGRVIDEIGVYHPCARPEPRTEVDVKRALHWLHEGAEPSDTVRSVLRKKGVMKMFADGVKAEDIVVEAPVSDAASEDVVDTPASDVAPEDAVETPASDVAPEDVDA